MSSIARHAAGHRPPQNLNSCTPGFSCLLRGENALEYRMVNDEIRKKLSQLPHKAGVYFMRDRLGRVIYVGKANDLRRRVSQYFHPSRRMTADMKTRALVDSICDFDFQVVKNDPEAILLEG